MSITPEDGLETMKAARVKLAEISESIARQRRALPPNHPVQRTLFSAASIAGECDATLHAAILNAERERDSQR